MNPRGAVDQDAGATGDERGELGDHQPERCGALRIGWPAILERTPDPAHAGLLDHIADLARTFALGQQRDHVSDAEPGKAGNVTALRAMGQRQRTGTHWDERRIAHRDLQIRPSRTHGDQLSWAPFVIQVFSALMNADDG